MKLRTLFAIALSVSFALPLPALSADAPLANVSYKRVPAFLNGEDVEGAWNLKAGDTVSTGNGVAYVLARYIDSTSLGVLAQSKVAFHKGWVDVAAGGVTVDLVAGTRHIRQLDFPMGVALLDATTGSVELKPAISDTNGVETRDLKFSVDAGRAEFQLTQLGGAATPLVSIVADAADRATCTFPTGSVSLSLASDRGELTVRLGDVAQLAIPQSARAVLAYDARKQAFRIESTRGEIAVAQGDKSTPVLMGASLEIPVALDSGKDHIVARGVPAPPPPVFDTTAAVPTSVATATPPPKPVIIWAPPAITKLPQDYDYQKTLRAYIGSLTEAEVAAGTEYPKVMPPGDDLEEMYRNYMLIFDTVPMVGRKRALSSITAPGKLFLLPAIETPEGVCRPHAWPEPLAWLTEWDYPGNPYRGSATMKRRAFVTAAVLLMLLDYTQEHDPEFGGCRVDGVALHLIQFGYTFQKVRSAVPQVAQQAFLAGLKRIVDRAFAWGPEGDTVGMDVAAAVGLHLCAEAINDPEIRLRSEAYTKRMVSDPEFFHPAGYWVTYGGYDGAYNGTARYYAVWLALLTGNKDVEAALAKAYRLRGHLALP